MSCRKIRRSIALMAFAIVCLGLAQGNAWAADTDKIGEARTHFKAASRFYDLAEYEAALVEFKEAYRAVDDPAFLFNIAQCHRKLGHTKEAITFYRTFVRRAPSSERRAEVERQIAELEQSEPAETPRPPPAARPAAGAAVVPDLSPHPPADPSSTPALSGAVVGGADVSPASAPDGPPGPVADTSRPFYRSGWFWVVTGVVLAGAVTTIVVLNARTPGSFCPECAGTATIDP